MAHEEQRVLVTDDRDFGDLVFRLTQPHSGVIYLRLASGCPLEEKVQALNRALDALTRQAAAFVVVDSRRVRVRER